MVPFALFLFEVFLQVGSDLAEYDYASKKLKYADDNGTADESPE